MKRWQRFILRRIVSKIRVHHGGTAWTDVDALSLVYKGMNSEQKRYKEARRRVNREHRGGECAHGWPIGMACSECTGPSPFAAKEPPSTR